MHVGHTPVWSPESSYASCSRARATLSSVPLAPAPLEHHTPPTVNRLVSLQRCFSVGVLAVGGEELPGQEKGNRHWIGACLHAAGLHGLDGISQCGFPRVLFGGGGGDSGCLMHARPFKQARERKEEEVSLCYLGWRFSNKSPLFYLPYPTLLPPAMAGCCSRI